MILKKLIFISSAFMALSFSGATLATTLDTVNNTDNPSAVRLLSGAKAGTCTGTLPPPLPSQYTKPHDSSHVQWLVVGLLCTGSAGNICKSEIHMTMDCSDASIGTVDLNLGTKSVENIINVANSGYKITGSGNTVYLDHL